MSETIFNLAPAITVPIIGERADFPINRIFCVGRNYAAHAAEMGNEVDRTAPFYFTTSPANVSLGGKVAYPAGTDDYHHEVEFVVALGSGGVDIAVEEALSCVYGYGVGLDMTRRDLQAAAKDKRRPWCLGKDGEAGTILSSLTKAEDFGAIDAQRICLTKNEEIVQDSTLSLMVHNVPELIAHLSRYYALTAGDIILTGTPEGVGPAVVGDRLKATIDGTSALEVEFV